MARRRGNRSQERKVQKAQAMWDPAVGMIDQSWQRFARCKVCKRRICVNNNAEREIRPPRKLGVVCCPWCSEEAVQLYVITKKLANATKVEDIKAIREMARERVGA